MGYGRVAAVVGWALDNWQYFDAWCCIKGVDPLELPAYRFYNLALFAIMEGKDDEQQVEIEEQLAKAEYYNPHPFHKPTGVANKAKAVPRTVSEDVEYSLRPNHSGLQSMVGGPRNEEAANEDKPLETQLKVARRIPAWYKGDEAAFHNAQVVMKGVRSISKK